MCKLQRPGKRVINFRKHIALLLFVVFLFPIVFQPVHIVWHHAHGYQCGHHHLHENVSGKDLQAHAENVTEKEHVCAICEFHFAINDLPGHSFVCSVMPAKSRIFNVLVTQHLYRQFFSFKSPRAPPALIA